MKQLNRLFEEGDVLDVFKECLIDPKHYADMPAMEECPIMYLSKQGFADEHLIGKIFTAWNELMSEIKRLTEAQVDVVANSFSATEARVADIYKLWDDKKEEPINKSLSTYIRMAGKAFVLPYVFKREKKQLTKTMNMVSHKVVRAKIVLLIAMIDKVFEGDDNLKHLLGLTAYKHIINGSDNSDRFKMSSSAQFEYINGFISGVYTLIMLDQDMSVDSGEHIEDACKKAEGRSWNQKRKNPTPRILLDLACEEHNHSWDMRGSIEQPEDDSETTEIYQHLFWLFHTHIHNNLDMPYIEGTRNTYLGFKNNGRIRERFKHGAPKGLTGMNPSENGASRSAHMLALQYLTTRIFDDKHNITRMLNVRGMATAPCMSDMGNKREVHGVQWSAKIQETAKCYFSMVALMDYTGPHHNAIDFNFEPYRHFGKFLVDAQARMIQVVFETKKVLGKYSVYFNNIEHVNSKKADS